MDDIQTRLQETSQNCLKAYQDWVGQKKDLKSQESLHVAIHELRKVSSRLEIELALSEREHVTSKPLPIPSHRSTNKKMKPQGSSFDGDDSNDAIGNNEQPAVKTVSIKRRRPIQKPESSEGN